MAFTRTQYLTLIGELTCLEDQLGVQLTCTNSDRQNVEEAGRDEETDPVAFWTSMYLAACMQAGMLADEASIDVNRAIGRVIY